MDGLAKDFWGAVRLEALSTDHGKDVHKCSKTSNVVWNGDGASDREVDGEDGGDEDGEMVVRGD